MEVAQGSLVMIDMNTTSPKVFWKGQLVNDIIKIVVRNDEDDADVKIVASKTNPILAEMSLAGINVKVRG